MIGYYRSKLIKRLIENHRIDSKGCYIWTGHITDEGYGSTHFNGRIHLVHRLSVMLFRDLEFDSKFNVRHKCENRACFNPDHLKIK